MNSTNKLFLFLTLLITLNAFSQSSLPSPQRINGSQVKQALTELADHTKKSIVTIINGQGQTVTSGVIVDSSGLILTKASELSQVVYVQLHSGKKYSAYFVGQDESTDLALLKVQAKNLSPLVFGPDITQEIGNWVVSPLYGQNTKIGIISAVRRNIKRVTGVIGIILGDELNEGVLIADAIKNGPAYAAGIRGGCILTQINGKSLKTRKEVLKYLNDKGPGTKVNISYLENSTVKNTELVLGDRTQTFKDFNRNLQMSGTISKRVDGFQNVLQHDIPLTHFETGTPLVGLSGKVIGINIARANRSEAYAIPNDQVKKALTKLLKIVHPKINWENNVKKRITLGELQKVQTSLKELLPKVSQATVALVINGSSGSGVIISEDGYILTAAHVSQNPGSLVTIILPNGKELQGRSLGRHLRGDLGLVKVTEAIKLPYLKVGKSQEHAQGDWCFALGHPGGFNKARGAVVRIGKIIDIKKNTLWSDCTLLGGDSGGPLFNFKGEVIGINSRVFKTSEENFHAPADLYWDFQDELQNSETIRFNRSNSAFLGVATTKTEKGLNVIEVIKGSSADKVGIIVGDLIKKIDTVKIQSTEGLISFLKNKKVGQKINILLIRGAKEITLSTKLGRRPQ
jgi:serine protease Do